MEAIIPGTIYPSKGEVEVALSRAYRTKEYVTVRWLLLKMKQFQINRFQILCSSTPSALRWIPAHSYQIDLTNEPLVIGGYQGYERAYIGRAPYGSNLIVGKVFPNNNNGLWIATPEGYETTFHSFEILIYDSTSCN